MKVVCNFDVFATQNYCKTPFVCEEFLQDHGDAEISTTLTSKWIVEQENDC